MAAFEARALHLHTLDSLLSDLTSGRPVLIGEGQVFSLSDDATRSALLWYKNRPVERWPANVSPKDGEDLVDAIQKPPGESDALPSRPANANSKKLTLKKIEAHRFAGLHKFGTLSNPPATYVHEFDSPITLFEGRNGSGKTSLLNAIIWALTGELLRPQRLPEKSDDDFDCWVDADGHGDPTAHKITPITPLPDGAYRPTEETVPTDTWVKLTFVDEHGNLLPPICRSQKRNSRGRPTEISNVDDLGLDPIGTRIGTVMPGLLGLIKVGSASELGSAVAELTGLSALVDLAGHARRAKEKIDKDYTRTKTSDRDLADEAYRASQSDLQNILDEHPDLSPSIEIPMPSEDNTIEAGLSDIKEHFEELRSTALASAQNILGETFDPSDKASKSNLESCIAPALSEIDRLSNLPSLVTLQSLKTLTGRQIGDVEAQINAINAEAHTLADLAKNPDLAARKSLYARISEWLTSHSDQPHDPNICVTCNSSLVDVLDPVTGKEVKVHIEEAAIDAALLSQSIVQWQRRTLDSLLATLPDILQSCAKNPLPAHPCDLLRSALSEELFEPVAFSKVLAPIKDQTTVKLETILSGVTDVIDIEEPQLATECADLQRTIHNIRTAMEFAKWRHANEPLARSIIDEVVGRRPKDKEEIEDKTLIGKLLSLEAIVKETSPLNEAIIYCERMEKELGRRRGAEKKLKEYIIASEALENLKQLGDLADMQVDALRKTLSVDAAKWRDKIYLGAFPSTAHELADTAISRKGELDVRVKSGTVTAPAQHVTNASALRASLVAFYLAFWHYVFNERGGLNIILFDDPQELLDDENRERLANALTELAKTGAPSKQAAQIIMTSHDKRFAKQVARATGVGRVAHFEVLPASNNNSTIRTIEARSEIIKRKETYDADPNDEVAAREFADACRVFMENKLADIFEDPAFSTWVSVNPDPTLSTYLDRLRRELASANTGSMFAAPVFRKFAKHVALNDGSSVRRIMNKAHHGQREEIRAGDIAPCAEDLEELIKLVEEMWDECSRWRRRDAGTKGEIIDLPPKLPALIFNMPKTQICADLAAFTDHTKFGGSQEPVEMLDPQILEDKQLYYIRRDNFGFAAPEGSLAIVEATATAIDDRRLVVARYRDKIYARRLLKSTDSDFIGLTAETPDPQRRAPKTIFVKEEEVAIHRVVGVIFDHEVVVEQGSDEAVQRDRPDVLAKVKFAYRIVEDSAVPLVLPGQVVLGGDHIELSRINSDIGKLVALNLSDGSSIFKRVGRALPGSLGHLRQFESIGGLGSSQVLAVGKPHEDMVEVQSARLIIGVLYHG